MPKAGKEIYIKLTPEEVNEWVERLNQFTLEMSKEFIGRLSNGDPSKFEMDEDGPIVDSFIQKLPDGTKVTYVVEINIPGWMNE